MHIADYRIKGRLAHPHSSDKQIKMVRMMTNGAFFMMGIGGIMDKPQTVNEFGQSPGVRRSCVAYCAYHRARQFWRE